MTSGMKHYKNWSVSNYIRYHTKNDNRNWQIFFVFPILLEPIDVRLLHGAASQKAAMFILFTAETHNLSFVASLKHGVSYTQIAYDVPTLHNVRYYYHRRFQKFFYTRNL